VDNIAAKRIKPRCRVTAGFLGLNVHLTGDVVDLSESGVLVRCSQSFELETVGRLGIERGADTFRTVAVARRRVPGVGVAFRFTQMSPRDRERLHRLLFDLGKDLSA
jgi:hypothetical protein